MNPIEKILQDHGDVYEKALGKTKTSSGDKQDTLSCNPLGLTDEQAKLLKLLNLLPQAI